jgi:hypothetical protein
VALPLKVVATPIVGFAIPGSLKAKVSANDRAREKGVGS